MSRESAQALAGLAPSPSPIAGTNPEPTLGGEPGLVPTPEAPKTPQELDSTRFAKLAKKESALVSEREAFKKEQELLVQERSKIQEVLKKAQAFEDFKSKGDGISALKAVGMSDTDIMNLFAMQEDNSTPEEKAAKAVQTEIQKFRDEQKKLADDTQAKRNKEVLETFRSNISRELAKDKDKYEYCNYYGSEAEALIEETVSAVLTSDKVLIPIQEATDMVEAFYEERDQAMATLKKRQLKVDQPPAEEPLKPQVSPRPSGAQSLSSRAMATVSSTTAPKKETMAEKKARLIQKLGSLGKQ